MRHLSQGCVYAGCYAAWAWLCLVLTATTLDESELAATVLFFLGAAVVETIRASRSASDADGENGA